MSNQPTQSTPNSSTITVLTLTPHIKRTYELLFKTRPPSETRLAFNKLKEMKWSSPFNKLNTQEVMEQFAKTVGVNMELKNIDLSSINSLTDLTQLSKFDLECSLGSNTFKTMDINTRYTSLRYVCELTCELKKACDQISDFEYNCFKGNIEEIVTSLTQELPQDVLDNGACIALTMGHTDLTRLLVDNVTITCYPILLHIATMLDDFELFKHLLASYTERDKRIISDLFGYSLMYNHPTYAQHIIQNFDVDQYGNFSGEEYSYCQLAFTENAYDSVVWILDTYPDIVTGLDFGELFTWFDKNESIPLIKLLIARYPLMKRHLKSSLETALQSNSPIDAKEQLILYVLNIQPSIQLDSYQVRYFTHKLTPALFDILYKHGISTIDNDDKSRVLNSAYIINNLELIKHIEQTYPEFNVGLLGNPLTLLKKCIDNGSLESADRIISTKNIDTLSLFNKLFHSRYISELHDFKCENSVRDLKYDSDNMNLISYLAKRSEIDLVSTYTSIIDPKLELIEKELIQWLYSNAKLDEGTDRDQFFSTYVLEAIKRDEHDDTKSTFRSSRLERLCFYRKAFEFLQVDDSSLIKLMSLSGNTGQASYDLALQVFPHILQWDEATRKKLVTELIHSKEYYVLMYFEEFYPNFLPVRILYK